MCTTFCKMLFESHLSYFTLVSLKNQTIFEFECEFGSKIELYLSLCIAHCFKQKVINFEF